MTYTEKRLGFEYKQLPSGIHELTLYTADTATYEQCFARLEQIFDETPPSEPLLLLSYIHQFDLQRIGDLWRLSRRLLINHPQTRPLYNAVVYMPKGMISALMMAMSQLAGIFDAKVYFCHADQGEKAINWLLSGKIAKH